MECAPCGGPSGPEMCNGQWALSFDVRYEYPIGPVCDWPVIVDCKMKQTELCNSAVDVTIQNTI